MDIEVLEKDLIGNLGLEKFSELPISSEDEIKEIDLLADETRSFVSYINYVSYQLFDERYDALSEGDRNLVLMLSSPILDAIVNGQVDPSQAEELETGEI